MQGDFNLDDSFVGETTIICPPNPPAGFTFTSDNFVVVIRDGDGNLVPPEDQTIEWSQVPSASSRTVTFIDPTVLYPSILYADGGCVGSGCPPEEQIILRITFPDLGGIFLDIPIESRLIDTALMGQPLISSFRNKQNIPNLLSRFPVPRDTSFAYKFSDFLPESYSFLFSPPDIRTHYIGAIFDFNVAGEYTNSQIFSGDSFFQVSVVPGLTYRITSVYGEGNGSSFVFFDFGQIQPFDDVVFADEQAEISTPNFKSQASSFTQSPRTRKALPVELDRVESIQQPNFKNRLGSFVQSPRTRKTLPAETSRVNMLSQPVFKDKVGSFVLTPRDGVSIG